MQHDMKSQEHAPICHIIAKRRVGRKNKYPRKEAIEYQITITVFTRDLAQAYDVASGLLLFPLSTILPILMQVAPVTTSTAHISRADDFITADVEFVTIVFYSSSLSNGCTVQFACFHVKAVVEIYTGHVNFKNHFHMKTCKLQTFSHELKFPGDEAKCPRVVCPLSTLVNTQNTGIVRRRVLPSCMG
jgi:hypothetical protein